MVDCPDFPILGWGGYGPLSPVVPVGFGYPERRLPSGTDTDRGLQIPTTPTPSPLSGLCLWLVPSGHVCTIFAETK